MISKDTNWNFKTQTAVPRETFAAWGPQHVDTSFQLPKTLDGPCGPEPLLVQVKSKTSFLDYSRSFVSTYIPIHTNCIIHVEVIDPQKPLSSLIFDLVYEAN